MASYTIELRDVLRVRPNIFDFRYDFYDESKRPDFERDFLRHFYFREIGVDTIDRFILNLEDKMKTVFPYYNKLLETTQLEYSILDNYNLKETVTTEREGQSGTRGESYTVGQVFDDQSTSSTDSRTEHNKEIAKGTNKNTRDTTDTTNTERSLNSDVEGTEGVEGTATKETDGTVTVDQNTIKRNLKTPQGKLDLKDAKYLTEMDDDDLDGTTTTDMDERTTNSHSKNTTESTDTLEKTDTSGTSKVVDDGATSNDLTGDTKIDGNASGTYKGEQKSTSDNNTRMKTDSKHKESMTTERRGNIGIDTDADMIQKHIKLQKLLTNIKQMFFDECDDLFMQVY